MVNIDEIAGSIGRMYRKSKFEEKLYFTMDSALGIPWTHGYFIGSRGRGKSFAGVETICRYLRKYGAENIKVYYFRISDLSIQTMLENNAAKAIDAKLVRKYNLDISRKGNTIFEGGKPFITFYPLVSAAKKGKGVAEYDPDFLNNRPKGVKRFIFCIIDEFMIDESQEKRSVGNPVEQFHIYTENIFRDQERLDYQAVRCMYFANSVSECSGFLTQQVGFVPETFGIFKMPRKHTIVYNIPNTKAYEEKRKNSYMSDIINFDEDSNYTNILKRDLETLVPKNYRKRKPQLIIKFGKETRNWYTLWDDNVIARWNKQTIKNTVPMKRHLEAVFDLEAAGNIFDMYDARYFKYTDLITQSTFAAHMKELKSK